MKKQYKRGTNAAIERYCITCNPDRTYKLLDSDWQSDEFIHVQSGGKAAKNRNIISDAYFHLLFFSSLLVVLDDVQPLSSHRKRSAAAGCRDGHRCTENWGHQSSYVASRKGRVYQLSED